MPNTQPLNAVQFNSKELTNTHQFITIQALNAVTNDFKDVDEKTSNVLKAIKENVEILKKGSIAPDYGIVGKDRDYALYQDHFYDCDLDANFTTLPGLNLIFNQVPDTAESQARAYFSRAIACYKDGNIEESIFHLGQATHYIADGCEPHHALLWIGNGCNAHTRFEKYTEKVKGDYTIDTVGDLKLYDMYKDDKFIDFIHKMAFENSRLSKELKPLVSLKNTWDDWNKAIDNALKRAQKSVAILIIRFIREVISSDDIVISSPLGKFHAIIKVADEIYAGTDDIIHLGVELKDGRVYDFECNLPGDDFKRATTGTYQCFLGDKTVGIKDVKGFYIRKVKELAFEDKMLLDEIEIYIQGKRVLKSKPYKWLSNIDNNDIIKFSI